tara:strand:+ start:5 stop:391 length:387 start_codon:yes stop_codon:yes gene_type:complete
MSKIESEKDMMTTVLASMLVAETNDEFKTILTAVYDTIVSLEDEPKGGTEGLRVNVLEVLEDIIDNQVPVPKPDNIDLDGLSKCFAAVLWCHRTVDTVQDAEDAIEAMTAMHDLIKQATEARFQQDNT